MKICYLDAFSGIGGDMTVGALADAGADSDALIEALDSMATGASFHFEKVKRRGIAATKFHVEGVETKAHRHLPHILRMIDGAGKLSPTVKQNAASVFQRLAEAEAQVHGTSIEKVHFHEAGAVDSIADIVGACFAFHSLGIDEIYCSKINVGSGTVSMDHGVLPVPAPATAALLKNVPIYARGPETELTTPTGAALAVTLGKGFGPMPAMKIVATGFGAGTKDFPDHTNLLRVLIGESTLAVESITVSVIEANIDDSSPQVLGYAMDRLLEAGALDVTLQPLLMKKNRQGTLLSIIAKPEDLERLAAIALAETSTLGLRIHTAERRVQARSVIEVETPHGTVRMKVTSAGFAPEYDDCRKLAAASGKPVKQIIAEANFAYMKEF